MVKLSDFVGAIITDLASARSYADYNAAAASEMYHADPFIKSLPVPHYVIDEAEVNVPVMVLGISTQSAEYEQKKVLLNKTLTDNLPAILLESFKWNYINERVEQKVGQGDKEKAKAKQFDPKNFEFDDALLAIFELCINEVTDTVAKKFASNLNLYNYAVLKLLEITESFKKELKFALLNMLKFISKDNDDKHWNPFLSAGAIDNAINYVSSIMFFNFKKIVQSDSGVLIDVVTSNIEIGQKDCLMHVKIKIKEHDLNLITEEKNKKEIRYLSLT